MKMHRAAPVNSVRRSASLVCARATISSCRKVAMMSEAHGSPLTSVFQQAAARCPAGSERRHRRWPALLRNSIASRPKRRTLGPSVILEEDGGNRVALAVAHRARQSPPSWTPKQSPQHWTLVVRGSSPFRLRGGGHCTVAAARCVLRHRLALHHRRPCPCLKVPRRRKLRAQLGRVDHIGRGRRWW